MIYVILAILYIAFAFGFAMGRRESGATIGAALVGGLTWPFLVGYILGRELRQ